MAGMDKYILGEKLKQHGWYENEKGKFTPPIDILNSIESKEFTEYDAIELHRLLTGNDINEN